MLVLSRKVGEEIVIKDEIKVRVLRVSGNRAFLAIEAPAKVSVDRQEIWLAKRRERHVAGSRVSAKVAGPEETRQSMSGGESGSKPEPIIGASFVRRAIPMLNRAAGKDRPEEDHTERDDDRGVVQPSIFLNGQPNSSSLRAAVHRLIAANRECDGPEIEFWDDLTITNGELRPELQPAMLSIVQELLLNACRHSKSKRVLLGLSDDDGYLSLQVQDWGIGFDYENAQPQKRGLKGLRDLVAWLGGTLEIDSERGKGTCIVVEIPLLPETKRSDSTCEHTPR